MCGEAALGDSTPRGEGAEYVGGCECDGCEYNGCEYDGCEYDGCEYDGCEYDGCEYEGVLIEKSDGLIKDSWVTARLVTGAVRLKDEALLRVSD